MNGNYDIHGATFTDPTVDVSDLKINWEDGVEKLSEVTVVVMDNDDSVSITIDASEAPSTTTYQAVKNWAENELKRYEV